LPAFVAAFMEHHAALRRIKVQLQRPRAHIARGLDIACGGIDRARCANGNEKIAIAQRRLNFRHAVGHFAKPDDVWPQ